MHRHRGDERAHVDRLRDDRWLLPRRQTEYPARDLLPEALLHGRRELTFLSLAALYLVATTAFLVLGTSRLIDVSALVAWVTPSLDVPFVLRAPLGVLPFALTFIAIAMICELFGRRRASALVSVGVVATIAVVGLLRLADLLEDGQAFGTSLAFASCCVVGHASYVIVFDRLRRRADGRGGVLRLVAAATVALALGWGACAVVLHAGSGIVIDPLDREAILSLAATSAASALAIVFVLVVPAAIVMRGLSLALRVGRELVDAQLDTEGDAAKAAGSRTPAFGNGSGARRLPPALIVDDEDDVPARGAAVQPFSSAEMKFFSEGDLAAD